MRHNRLLRWRIFIPLAKGLAACKEAVARLDMEGRFVYERERKSALVEFKEDRSAGTYFDYFKNGQDAHALCMRDFRSKICSGLELQQEKFGVLGRE